MNISTEINLGNRYNNGAVVLTGLSVEVRNGDVNGALRIFKKKVQESGILQELRDKEFYEKPTTTRKKAKAAAKARWRKKQAKDQLNFTPQKKK
jgi:small subunit ribosomal protein S21